MNRCCFLHQAPQLNKTTCWCFGSNKQWIRIFAVYPSQKCYRNVCRLEKKSNKPNKFESREMLSNSNLVYLWLHRPSKRNSVNFDCLLWYCPFAFWLTLDNSVLSLKLDSHWFHSQQRSWNFRLKRGWNIYAVNIDSKIFFKKKIYWAKWNRTYSSNNEYPRQ